MGDDTQQLEEHLAEVERDPTTPINQRILAHYQHQVELDLIASEERLELIKRLALLIPQLRQDPDPIAELTAALLKGHDGPSFLQLMGLRPEIDLVAGLHSSNEAINQLTLRLLARARSSADVGVVAGKPEVVLALVQLWLSSGSAAVASQAEDVLISLLGAESPVEEDGCRGSVESFPTHEAVLLPSTSLVWRRIFKDRDVYGSIFATCSIQTVGQPGQMDRRRKTIAQARLLDLLKQILYAPQLWESQLPDVEREYGVTAGLLDFALRKMVDWEDDVLMHITLVNFCTAFISYDGPHGAAFTKMTVPVMDLNTTTSLELMQDSKLHDWAMAFYLSPESENPLSDYLYGPGAAYISAYARTYPEHFHSHTAQDVLKKASVALSSTRPSAWANNRGPSHDVKLLAEIPRHVLMSIDSGQVVSLLPVKPANCDALNALAQIFRGPETSEGTRKGDPDFLLASTSTYFQAEQAAARALCVLYVAQRPEFWKDVTNAADMATNAEVANSAIRLIHAIAVANWAALPNTPRNSQSGGTRSALHYLPTESQLQAFCPRTFPSQAQTGAFVLITEPAIGLVLPWLVSGLPPRPSVTNTADPEIYGLAVARHRVLTDLLERLRSGANSAAAGNWRAATTGPAPAWRELLDVLERRERMGPMATSGVGTARIRIPNPEVGTMEM